MVLLIGAAFSAVLGFKLMGWWAPAGVAAGVLVLQAAAYQGVLSTANGTSGFVQLLAFTGLTSLFLFYATFSMGRSLGLRWRRRR